MSRGLDEVRVWKCVCGFGDQEMTEAGPGSWVVAQRDEAKYDWEENTEKCDGCEEIAGRLGEKGDGDEESIQKSGEYSVENRCMCLVFGI